MRDRREEGTGVRAKKSLGQNFLMHQATAERIADAAQIKKDDTVLEIGPGTGMLTRALLTRAKKVVAVETDGELVERLQETFAGEIRSRALELVHEDIRTFNTGSLGSYVLVANIPYYITGEIMRLFLSGNHKPSSMTLLVQKEVAERIARSKKESLLSLSAKVYGTPAYRFTVSKGSFVPKPKVDSAVLSITDIRNPFVSTKEEEQFFAIIRAGFAHKRKLLLRNLEEVAEPEAIKAGFSDANIPLKARSEDIGLTAWRTLARVLSA